MMKKLYELKQAPITWNKRNGSFLVKINFYKCTSEHEVYVKGLNEQVKLFPFPYVDDILVRSSKENELATIKAIMDNEFEMSDLRNLSHVLGMKITNTEHGGFLH